MTRPAGLAFVPALAFALTWPLCSGALAFEVKDARPAKGNVAATAPAVAPAVKGLNAPQARPAVADLAAFKPVSIRTQALALYAQPPAGPVVITTPPLSLYAAPAR